MNSNREVQFFNIASLFGIIGGVFYFLHVIIGGIFYEGYNPLAQAISDLTALDSPSRNIASFFSFLYGICTVTVCVVVFTVTSVILFSIGFLKAKNHKYLGVISTCTLALLFAGAMLLNIVQKAYFGAAERINVYSVVIYTGILSLWMNKYIIKTGA